MSASGIFGKHASTIVGLLNDVVSIIEVIRDAQRTGLLNSSADGIVLEGRCSYSRISSLYKAVLEVPGEAPALSIGQSIAVCVIRVTTR